MKNFVVYRSSAGSGKTFTLVKEYLKLSLCDEKRLSSNYKSILAITFTNKAASEMKSRVIEALSQVSDAATLPFVGKLLCDELKITESELRKRAKVVLSHILHHYSDFSIGTIDSFTHKIVKTFAFDLKLPVNFNIELDTRGFYDRVVALLFNKIGEDKLVSTLLREFALSKAEANTAWDPENQLQEFSNLLLKEDAANYIGRLKNFSTIELEAVRKQFVDYLRHYGDTLKAGGQKAIDMIAKNNLSDEDFNYKKSGPQSFFYKCASGTATLDDAKGSRISEAVQKNKWAGKGPNAALVDTIGPELTQIAIELIHFIEQNFSYYALCSLLGKQMYPLMLLKKIEEISAEQKEEDNLVFISEFNQKIFEIIQNEPTPFIYERLGERYHHYLLDEFQDTSSLQWQNVLPLIDNSLSNGWFNLLVGDGKQSIYRWRNASVKQFAALPQIENSSSSGILTERQDALIRNFEDRLLNTNFRSQATVIAFNNRLFEHLSGNKLITEAKQIYNGHAQQVRPGSDKDSGYVTIQSEPADRSELDETTCLKIKQHIERALEDGYHYRDICLLPRRNYDGNTIATFLTKNKIPVISSDSLLLKNNLEVNTLLSYLRYLVNDRDTVSAAAVINYLHVTKKIDANRFHTYLEQLSGNKPLSEVLTTCAIHLPESGLALNNLLDNCIAISRALQLDANAPVYIRFFMDEVSEFLTQKNSNPGLFLQWWETRSQKASLIIPEGTNAVRIMTIHASKGLEFPVVIVPFCNWQTYRQGDAWVELNSDKTSLPVTVVSLNNKAAEAGFERELEAETREQILDNVNLLYVAFTRAVDRLHIIADHSTGNTKETVSTWLNEFVALNFTDVSDIYEFGKRVTRTSYVERSAPDSFELAPLKFIDSGNTIRIKASYLNNSEPAAEAKRQGILVHWLLSKIRSERDITAAFKTAMAEGLIHPGEQNELLERLQKVIGHPQLKGYFKADTNSKNEAELITSSGQILRPDKIVFDQELTIIIDYKTGKPDNHKYLKQLNDYENALKSMGHHRIKKLLVYVDDLDIVELK